uniref:Uncharacterized protein n=1 Tax=Plectus sambesii TaxID=2011161 RepID=A0A914W6I6_9BILA
MASSFVWKPRARNYKREWETSASMGTEVFLHPLRPQSKAKSASMKADEPASHADGKLTNGSIASKKPTNGEQEKPQFIDPLGATLDGGLGSDSAGLDGPTLGVPVTDQKDRGRKTEKLKNSLAVQEEEDDEAEGGIVEVKLPGFEPWASKRMAILQQYTTNERLTITTSFLPGGVLLNNQLSVADKTAHRLEQFDDGSSMKRMADLSQQDYVNVINQMNQTLMNAWASDQRVESVKVVIQSAKLLSMTSVEQFYPSQFVLITDILDTFGKLVYGRLWSKANQERISHGESGLGNYFEPDDVPDTSQETARNWFYKIASVRELLPRFYVETAILPCLRFLESSPGMFSRNLLRLAGMIRGMANPLVAAYARLYLCRVGMAIEPHDRRFAWKVLHDWLQSWKPMERSPEVVLLWPAVTWVVQCVAYQATQDDLLSLWEYCKQPEKRALLLTPLLSALPAPYLAANAREAAELVLTTTEADASPCDLIKLLGKRLIEAEPSPDVKRAILRHVWRAIMKFKKLDDYIACAAVWIEYACRYFGTKEINTLIDDIIRHVLPDKAYEDYYNQLLAMLEKIVNNQPNLKEVLEMERFVAFVDLFRADSVRLRACNTLLAAFIRFQPARSASDLTLANHILTLCKSLHDSLNALSLEDERRATALLLCRALDRFSFPDNPEQMLSFLVEARGSLSNLDDVVEFLVVRVNGLAVETRNRVSGRHSRKTAYFTRACVANVYITIPSIVDQFVRMRLYTQSAGVALLSNCLPQADALLKAAISLIPDLPTTMTTGASTSRKKSAEPMVVELVSELMSLLLVVPDSPEQQQPLYLFKGLMNAVRRYSWTADSDYKSIVLLRSLGWLSTAAQAEYPFHVESVESNDALYGGAETFMSVVVETASEALSQLLEQVRDLQSRDTKRQAALALDLVDCLLHHADVENDQQMADLMVKLWTLAAKCPHVDRTRMKAIAQFVQSRQSAGWTRILQRMKGE